MLRRSSQARCHPTNTRPCARVGSSHVGDSTADLVAVEDSSSTALGGHLVFVWTVDHHTYAFGFHGTDDHAGQLDDALAKDMQLVTG